MASGPCPSESETQKLDVSTLGRDGNTPLHEAVQEIECSNPEDAQKLDEKHIQIIKLLLKYNPDVNVKNSRGYTPLHLAIKNERSVSVLEALTKGSENVFIDADAVNSYGEASIHEIHKLKSAEDAVKLLSFLMRLKADINKRNYKDETILHMAIVKNDSDLLIKAILDHGADINATDGQGRTALYNVVFPTQISNDGNTLNFKFRNVEKIKCFVEKGAKIHTLAKNGYSPLLLAVVLKKTEYVKAMLEKVSNLSEGGLEQAANTFCFNYQTYRTYPSPAYYNMTPLLISVYDCNKELAQMLIKAGASVNAVNSSGESALHMIIKGTISVKNQEQEEQIGKLLIENGIDLNAKDKSGGTALNYAIRNNKHDIAVYMLERGLDKL